MVKKIGTAKNDTLLGTNAADFLAGGLGNDFLAGSRGNDTLRGGAGDDTLVGGAGNDQLDGGVGTDTAVYSAALSSYTFAQVGGAMTVSGPNGTDTLHNVEVLKFADQTVVVGENHGPVANNDIGSVSASSILNAASVLGNDTDLDITLGKAESLSVTEVNGISIIGLPFIVLPSGAKLTMNANGTYTYDPNGAFANVPTGLTAPDTFTYTVHDAHGGSATATVTVNVAGTNPITGQVFDLTLGTDSITGTGQDDIIRGIPSATYTTGDFVDGGAGMDLLVLASSTPNGDVNTNTALFSTVKNVEKVQITAGDDIIADVSTFQGLQQVDAKSLDTGPGNSNVTITTGGNATTVNVTSEDNVIVTDAGPIDALTTVSLTGQFGHNSTINSDVLTSLMIKNNTSQNITVNGVGPRTLTVDLNNVTGNTNLTDNTATTVNLNSNGGPNHLLNATFGSGSANVGGATHLVVDTFTVAGGGSINASGNTAGIDITNQLQTSVAFTGTGQHDSIVVGATTRASNMGGGDDSVRISNGVGALGGGGSVDGGAGKDTLMAQAADAAALSTIAGQFSNFEILSLSTALSGQTIDLDNLLGPTHAGEQVNLTGVTTGANVIKNIFQATTTADATTIDLGAGVGAGSLDLQVKNAVAGLNDHINLVMQASNTGPVSINNVEVVDITTRAGGPFGANLQVGQAREIDVHGISGVNFDAPASLVTGVTTLNASGVTGGSGIGDVTFTAAATANSLTLTGGNGDDALTGSAGTDIITGNGGNDSLSGLGNDDTISGGSGNDTVLGGAGNDSIDGGIGSDSLVGGADNDTINGGDGDDIISGGTGSDLLNGGAGADTYTSGTGSNILVVQVDSVATQANLDQQTDFGAAFDDLRFFGINVAGSATNYDELGAFASFALARLNAGADFAANPNAVYVETEITGVGTIIWGDINGDNAPDTGILLQGVANASVSFVDVIA